MRRRLIVGLALAWACLCSTVRVLPSAAAASRGGPSSFDAPTSSGRARRHALEAHERTRRRPSKPSALRTVLAARAGAAPQPSTQTKADPTNKKYTSAATSALSTIASLRSKSRTLNLPDLMSESALMDRETNAIYWQGGAKILSTSFTVPYLTRRGVVHVKATVLSFALWMWAWGKLSRYLAGKYFGTDGRVEGHKLLFALPFISAENAPPLLRKVAAVLAPLVQFVMLLCHSLLYLRLPPYAPKVIAATIVLYLLESYTCSTRRYLSHALNAPAEVESYLEKLRGVEPCVTWKVRCFHYENRDIWGGLKGVGKLIEGWRKGDAGGGRESGSGASANSNTASEMPSPLLARKVVTHEAVGNYTFGRWEDHTLASVWKRSQSFSATSQEAPFSKLSLSKLLVLKDRAAREDYFAQQAAFVMKEGRKDVHAEFATSISVEGFRPKVLAVRPVRFRASNVSAALFRQHIYVLFTLLGLSLPYRIWFAKHCDEIRVTVVKETSSNVQITKSEGEAVEKKSSWFRKWGKSPSISDGGTAAQELFRKSMQSYSLYEDEQVPADSQPAAMVAKHAEETASQAEIKDIESTEVQTQELLDHSAVETCGDDAGHGEAETAGDEVPAPDGNHSTERDSANTESTVS